MVSVKLLLLPPLVAHFVALTSVADADWISSAVVYVPSCKQQKTKEMRKKTQWKSQPALTTLALKVEVMGSSTLRVGKLLWSKKARSGQAPVLMR